MKRQITNDGIIFSTEDNTYSILQQGDYILIKEEYNKSNMKDYNNYTLIEPNDFTFKTLKDLVLQQTYNIIFDIDLIIEIVTNILDNYDFEVINQEL